MKRSELFLKLQKGMEQYKSKVKLNDNFDEKDKSVQYIMSRYNLENFNDLINSSYEELDDEVDEEELKDLENRIDEYFTLYSPDDEEFREFIKKISVYITFIAKKPLHPPGIKFSNGIMLYKKGDTYYCTGKSLFIKKKHSLCKYCIARYE